MHRDRLQIMAEALDIAREGALKTHIMYKTNLSFKQLYFYLNLLLDRKLLETIKREDSEKTLYRTTDKGLEFLKSYKEIKKSLT